jgi:predicted membrane-bound spermidine synthase
MAVTSGAVVAAADEATAVVGGGVRLAVGEGCAVVGRTAGVADDSGRLVFVTDGSTVALGSGVRVSVATTEGVTLVTVAAAATAVFSTCVGANVPLVSEPLPRTTAAAITTIRASTGTATSSQRRR